MSAVGYSVVELNEEVLIQYSPNIVIYIHAQIPVFWSSREVANPNLSIVIIKIISRVCGHHNVESKYQRFQKCNLP